MKKRTLVIIASVLSVIVGLCIVFLSFLLSRPFGSSSMVYIDADDTADSVYVKLETNLKPSSLTGLKWMVALKGYSVRTGAYQLGPECSALAAYRTLANGQQTPVNLVVPSVRTLEQAWHVRFLVRLWQIRPVLFHCFMIVYIVPVWATPVKLFRLFLFRILIRSTGICLLKD